VATTTLSAPTARKTTIALKLLMAVTGAFFVLYVLLHMYGNLKVLAGQEAFDTYAHHLRTFGEPMLPYGGLLWIFRILLLGSLSWSTRPTAAS
jgi:succinate dehydrogenase / fumarate reductase cytochrome b subunit